MCRQCLDPIICRCVLLGSFITNVAFIDLSARVRKWCPVQSAVAWWWVFNYLCFIYWLLYECQKTTQVVSAGILINLHGGICFVGNACQKRNR
ncbi:hypothetical protein ACE6H2_008751 [Prunus campanulata]